MIRESAATAPPRGFGAPGEVVAGGVDAWRARRLEGEEGRIERVAAGHGAADRVGDEEGVAVGHDVPGVFAITRGAVHVVIGLPPVQARGRTGEEQRDENDRFDTAAGVTSTSAAAGS
ncbi:hypothetical protein [Agromyces mediolanus]|uniref:hypothetical protein n=1 Tax=Agromyces mediolanus TaxID=41986 RepID=UPI00166CCE70|nr:hypothetical protein [Agromyces mediolanus]